MHMREDYSVEHVQIRGKKQYSLLQQTNSRESTVQDTEFLIIKRSAPYLLSRT